VVKFLVIAAIYGAATFGLVSATLIPWRGWKLMRMGASLQRGSIPQQVRYWLMAAVVVAALLLDVMLVRKLLGCINETHCGPNRVAGMLVLADIGFWYVVLEVVGFLVLSPVTVRAGRAKAAPHV
jgi:hypothetical protein